MVSDPTKKYSPVKSLKMCIFVHHSSLPAEDGNKQAGKFP